MCAQELEKLMSYTGTPTVAWRRTGEIYKANREFAELVGVDGYMLRDVSAPDPSAFPGAPLNAHHRPNRAGYASTSSWRKTRL